ncbi:hypothetical protein [Paludisphaera sp.]|uniref:HEAT repeat domain-containing protein n=1 Tax=Paludisphaera sp. TaxID=2017432 RepID=UPI00301CB897
MIRRPIFPATAVAVLALALLPAGAVSQDAPARPRDEAASIPVEVSDVSIWIADPTRTTLNTASIYRNAMPGAVGTSRPRREGDQAAELFPIAPVSFTQFFGEPSRGVDVDLKVKAGSFLAHWPIGKEHAGRIRWFGSDLLAEPPADIPPTYLPDDGGLFSKLREASGALYLKNETRFERFLAYDAEPSIAAPIRLRGGPDEYTLQNMTSRPLVDVAVVVPTEAGLRVGWIDELPSAAAEAEKKEAEAKKPPDEKADPAKQAEAVFAEAEKPEKKEADDAPPPLPAEGDADMKARVDQFLNRRLTFAVESAPRRELLGMVGSEARLGLEFDEGTLTKEKVDLAKPTSLKAAEAPARDLLADLLGPVNLSYRVTDQGRLYITTAARLAAAAEKGGGPIEGPPIAVGLSQPLKAGDESYREFTRDALARRLEGRGARKDVIALILDVYGKDLFEPGELIVLAHLSREAIDEAVTLDVFPPPAKFTRVALVVVRGVDPKLQDRAKLLVRQLGDGSWKARQEAEARLQALGPAAVPALEEALRDKDVEVVYRVERLLLRLGRDVP